LAEHEVIDEQLPTSSNRSRRAAFPAEPSKTYSFPIQTIGSLRLRGEGVTRPGRLLLLSELLLKGGFPLAL